MLRGAETLADTAAITLGPKGRNVVLEQKDTNVGFDAERGECVEMVASGIIDPVNEVRSALQNAASIASLMLTTEVVVAEMPAKAEPEGSRGDIH